MAHFCPAFLQQGATVGIENTHAHTHSLAHIHEVLQNCDKTQHHSLNF